MSQLVLIEIDRNSHWRYGRVFQLEDNHELLSVSGVLTQHSKYMISDVQKHRVIRIAVPVAQIDRCQSHVTDEPQSLATREEHDAHDCALVICIHAALADKRPMLSSRPGQGPDHNTRAT